MAKGPNILVLDIETSPNRVYSWGTYNQFIGIEQIIEQGRILCFAAKWLGGKEVIFASEWHNSREDMLDKLWNLLDKADAVIGYNSQSFDLKWVNAEFAHEGLLPPTPYQHIDLLKTVRKHFKHPSNKLDYICQRLDIGRKVKHYGFQLWRDVMAGNAKAWSTMKSYNKRDVKLTEELYYELLPWIDNHVNHGLWLEDGDMTCRNCGSTELEECSPWHTATKSYPQYRCHDCGRINKGKRAIEKDTTGVLK